jgi:hypothetical protein
VGCSGLATLFKLHARVHGEATAFSSAYFIVRVVTIAAGGRRMRLISRIRNEKQHLQSASIYEEGNKTDCRNCRGRQVYRNYCYQFTHTTFCKSLLSRLTQYAGEITEAHNWGCRHSRWDSCRVFVFCIRHIFHKKNGVQHQIFTDFKKAYDSVRREVVSHIFFFILILCFLAVNENKNLLQWNA